VIAFLAMAVCTAATLIGVVALVRATRPRAAAVRALPPVTVLKPLCGADDALAANLETFFVQRYPRYELLFGVADADDPAVPVVRALMARHPDVPARLVVHDGRRGLNPKVANLRGMLAAGGHDACVISDSNIAVGPGWLESMAAELDGRVGLVMSLFAGAGARTLGATLDSLHTNGSIAGTLAASELLSGSAVVVGKSLMFRRSVLESLGGLESLASVLAEDYVMGRMFTEAGYTVRIADQVVDNVTVRASVWGFVRRQARWGLMRSRLKPLLYPLEPLLNPFAVGVAAAALDGSAVPLLWALGLALVRDTVSWLRLRGGDGLLAAVPLGLVKDALVLGAWAAAPWKRHVSWRGHRLRVSAGSRLFAETAALSD
jgi:ceramide glucosyltransferase